MAGAPQGYIGRNPSDGRTTINRQTFNVTTGVQTSFTFTSGYDLGYLDVYLNGVKQNETTDYTAADGSTFSFASSTPAVQGDTIEAIAYKSFNTTNVTGSTRDFNVGRNLDVAGNVTIGSSLTIASDLTVNGTYTYVNTEILDIEDKTIGIASTSAASNTTADGAGIIVYGGSDGDKSLTWNRQKSNWVLVGGGVSIGTGCTIGSSTANVLEFSVDGAVNAKLNNYGAFIVGDGVAGEAWGNDYKTVQAGTGAFGGNSPAANAASYWTANAYYDDVNSRWEYIAADEASRFEQGNGALAYYNASSGSADGAITWTERLRITSAGRMGIGENSPDGMLHLKGSVPAIYLEDSDGTHGQAIIEQVGDSIKIRQDAGNSSSGTLSDIRFEIDATERLRLTTTGGVVTGILTATSFSGPMSGTTGTFTGDVSIADKIVHIGDTNTAIRFPAADTISFETSGGEQLRISSGGQILGGLTTPYSTVLSNQTPKIQLESTSVSGSSMFLLRDGADAGGPFLFLGHGRGGATIVQSGDELGNITFVGADGTNFQNAAAIKGLVDGTPGSGTDMPGRLSFWTSPDGSTTMAERLRITSAGKLHVKGTRAGILQPEDDDALQLYTASTDNSINRGSGITFYNHDNSGYEMGGTIQVAKENGTADNVAAYMRFSTRPAGGSATERLRITSDGAIQNYYNSSLPVTDSRPIFQLGYGVIGDNSSGYNDVTCNAYPVNGDSSYHYIGSSSLGATRYQLTFGSHIWSTASAGTRGNDITWSERFRIASDGKVSIGSLVSADSLLHIHDGSAGSITASSAAKLTIESSASDYNVLQFLSPSTAAQQIRFGDASDNGAGWIQYNHDGNSLTVGANGPERLRITSNGDVGIGTDSPSYRLQVQESGGALFRVLTGHESTYDLRYVYQNSETNIWSYGSTDLTFGTRYNQKLHLVTNGPGKRLTVDGSGKVGINDTAPSYVLNVAGDNASSNGAGMVKGIIGVQNNTTAFGSSPTAGISFQTKYRSSPDVPLDVAAVYGGKENTSDADKDGYFGIAVREEGGTASELERLRINSNGQLITKNVLDSTFMLQVNESWGVWHTNTGLAPNTTRTWTISGMYYGHGTFRIGGLDGNYQRGGCVIEIVGGFWATAQVYYYEEVLKNNSGISLSVTYNTDNIVVSVTSGSNWWYYTASFMQGRRNGSVWATVTVG